MENVSPFVITISRQLGSGGSYLGQRLAARLNIAYLDREIISEAAKKLQVSEDTIASNDEKLDSFWQRLIKPFGYYPAGYQPPSINLLTDKIVHSTQSEVISQVAQHTSVVVIGRGGFYLLKQHPRHLSIFLHANISFRQQRVQKLYNLSGQQALQLMESVDRVRAQYLRALTGQHWTNALEYNLSLDTSVFGLDKSEDIIIEAVKVRLGNIKDHPPS